MKSVNNSIHRIINGLLVFFLTGLTILTALQIADRFVVAPLRNAPLTSALFAHWSVSWVSDLLTLCFTWTVCLGTAVGVREKGHLSLDMFSQKISKTTRIAIDAGVNITILLTDVIFLLSSWQYMRRNVHTTLTTLDWSANLRYSATFVAGWCILLFILEILLEDLRNWKKRGEA